MFHRARRRLAAHPDVGAHWARDSSARPLYLILTAASALLAVVLALGGDARLSAPAFSTLRALGGAAVWAPLCGVCALALVVAARVGLRACHAALRATAAVWLLVALGFSASAATSPSASWFGALSFGTLALLLLHTAALHRRTCAEVTR